MNKIEIRLANKQDALNGFKDIGNHDFQIGKENFEFISMGKLL